MLVLKKLQSNGHCWSSASIGNYSKECWLGKVAFSVKAAFTLIYILIVYILLVNKIVYKWLHLYTKT